jgi:hypothetical protein
VAEQPRRNPAIVADGTGYSVAWNEAASTPRAVLGGVDSRGTVRPATTLSAPVESRVKLVRVGGRTLAVWATSSHVYAQFADESAQLLGVGDQPDVATDGSTALVVWRQFDHIVSSLVTASGVALTPDGQRLTPEVAAQSLPTVASRGTDYLVAWAQNGNGINAIGVSSAGFVNGSPLALASTASSINALDVEASGRTYLIAAAGAAFAPTSLVQDILVTGVDGGIVRVQPRDGGGFAVLHGGAPLQIANIDAAGRVQSDSALPITVTSADFVFDRGRFVVAYTAADQLFVEMFDPRRRAAR